MKEELFTIQIKFLFFISLITFTLKLNFSLCSRFLNLLLKFWYSGILWSNWTGCGKGSFLL